MGIFKKKQQNVMNYLELTPSRIHQHEIKDNGLINVLVPKFHNKFVVKHFMSRIKRPYIKANLDEFGTATWLEIDSNKKVIEIANKLIEQFGDKIQPVNERLTLFLTQMYQAGFISFNELEKGKNNE